MCRRAAKAAMIALMNGWVHGCVVRCVAGLDVAQHDEVDGNGSDDA